MTVNNEMGYHHLCVVGSVCWPIRASLQPVAMERDWCHCLPDKGNSTWSCWHWTAGIFAEGTCPEIVLFFRSLKTENQKAYFFDNWFLKLGLYFTEMAVQWSTADREFCSSIQRDRHAGRCGCCDHPASQTWCTVLLGLCHCCSLCCHWYESYHCQVLPHIISANLGCHLCELWLITIAILAFVRPVMISLMCTRMQCLFLLTNL